MKSGIEEGRKLDIAISNFNDIQKMLFNMKDFKPLLRQVQGKLKRMNEEPGERVSNALMAASACVDLADEKLKQAWKLLNFLNQSLNKG